jgi:hypothetical protein
VGAREVSKPEPPEKGKHHLLIIIGVGKPKPGQKVGFRSAKKKTKPKAEK